MNHFVLKTKKLPLVFEIGFFNIFALTILLPTFWLQLVGMLCWNCCRNLEPFYKGNLWRLGLIGFGLFIFVLLEVMCFSQLLERSHKVPWRVYLGWMFWRTLPLIALLLAVLALPGSIIFYGLFAIISGLVFLGPIAIENRWIPVFMQLGQQPVVIRHHLKALVVYLLFVFLLPPIFVQVRPWDCVTSSSVKANMHTLQTIVETYAVDHQGQYPQDLTVLKQQATMTGREYWKEFTNPYTGKRGLGYSYSQFPRNNPQFGLDTPADGAFWYPYRDILGVRVYHQSFLYIPKRAGMVIYAPVSPRLYYIYGIGIEGTFIFDKGQSLTLSNS